MLKTSYGALAKFLLLFILSAGGACASRTVIAEDIVLLLNSYHPQYGWTKALTEGVTAGLEEHIKSENLHIEYLDGRYMIDDPVYKATLKNRIQAKYSRIHPNVIIASDDYAVDFLLENGDELFPNVPVVYLGVNFLKPELARRQHYIGILEDIEVDGNIELIHQLLPDLTRLIVLTDNTGFGKRVQGITQNAIEIGRSQGLWQETEFEIWSDFSLETLYQDLSELPENSAVLMVAIHTDNQGHYFSYKDDLQELTAHSRVPVFGMFGATMLGNGIIGGLINSPQVQGQEVAKLAVQLLKGMPVSRLPKSQIGHYFPKFDTRRLEQFDIDKSRLPRGSELFFEHSQLAPKARQKWLLVSVLGVLSLLLAVLLYNVLRRKEAEKRANTDVLTQLPNRRAGEEWLKSRWLHSHTHQSRFAVGVLDIDHFKRVNDEFGHDGGDKVLIEVSQRIQRVLRATDKLYRWGGEEFVIYFDFVDTMTLEKVGERIRTAIADIDITPVGKVTASMGLAVLRENDTLESLLLRADSALYRAKESGRNRVCTESNKASSSESNNEA